MSSTLQMIGLIGGAIIAFGVIWQKAVLPAAHLITDAQKMLPYLKLLPLLEDITAQFGPDSGHMMKDAINRLEGHAEDNKALTEQFAAANRALINELQREVGVMRELSKDDRDLARKDRQQLLDILRSSVRIEESGVRTEASGVRVEESGVRTEASGVRVEKSGARTEASDARTEAADRAVAKDLAAAQDRADKAEEEDPGGAADAASRSPEAQ
jgi:hypothetical protein